MIMCVCFFSLFRVFLTNRLHYVPGYHNADAQLGKSPYVVGFYYFAIYIICTLALDRTY